MKTMPQAFYTHVYIEWYCRFSVVLLLTMKIKVFSSEHVSSVRNKLPVKISIPNEAIP